MNITAPYYAVIFTSISNKNDDEYSQISQEMEELAVKQNGYLGHESARDKIGITVSYWRDLESIKNWKKNSQHLKVQKLGRDKFYSFYKVRICKVEREYDFGA